MKIGNRKTLTVFVLLTCAFFSFATLASGDEPSATVSIESTSVAIGIGVQWGHGTLKYKGQEYKFSIGGLSVVDLGPATDLDPAEGWDQGRHAIASLPKSHPCQFRSCYLLVVGSLLRYILKRTF